jgi:hypothetical protein
MGILINKDSRRRIASQPPEVSSVTKRRSSAGSGSEKGTEHPKDLQSVTISQEGFQ